MKKRMRNKKEGGSRHNYNTASWRKSAMTSVGLRGVFTTHITGASIEPLKEV